MIEYFFGIITGLVVSVLIFNLLARYGNSVNRTFEQLGSKLKVGGKVFNFDDEELQEWVNTIKKDE